MKNLLLVFLSVIIISCDNQKDIYDLKGENTEEAQEIESARNKYEKEMDSLNKDIDSLLETKSELKKRSDFSEIEIFRIIGNAYLDHAIFGSHNLNDSKTLFEDKLGFSIKEGRVHKNGISNFFVEFSDSSEIEIMSVKDPSDHLAKQYSNLLDNDKYGFQFALRTNEIIILKEHLETLSLGYNNFFENRIYSTLSTKNINGELPLIFIQYNDENKNTYINHPNKSLGIKSIWFYTSDIKKTARQLVDFGFNVIGGYELPIFKKKTVQFKNNNFEIILIESDNYEISGITIIVDEINTIKNFAKTNFSNDVIEQNRSGTKSILLKPALTKSIWIEFVEN